MVEVIQTANLHILTNIRYELTEFESQAKAARMERAGIIAMLMADGMTMAEIAEYCGVTRQAVHYWAKS